MSTPRQKCPCGYDYCGYYIDENGKVVEGVKPLEPTRQEFEKWGADTLGWRHEDFARESKQFHSGESYESPEVQVAWLAWKAEGVAAPLEPSQFTAKDFWLTSPLRFENRFEFAEAYAAAVSKSLTDKYAEMEAKWMRELLTVSDEIGEARKELDLVKRVLLQHLNDEDFEYSLVGLYAKLTENDDVGKSPR